MQCESLPLGVACLLLDSRNNSRSGSMLSLPNGLIWLEHAKLVLVKTAQINGHGWHIIKLKDLFVELVAS
jgi:hypothetical protein